MRSIRVLYVINAPIVGGAELHTALLAQALAPYGFEALVFSLKTGSHASLDGQHVSRPSTAKSLAARIRDLRSVLVDYRADIVVCVNELPLLAAFFASRKLERPPFLVSIYHTTVPRSLDKAFKIRIHFQIFKRCDLVIFVSRNQRAYWLRRGMRPRQDLVVRNGIDVEAFSSDVRALHREASRSQLNIPPDAFTVCHVGMMRPEKNHLHTLRAFALLRKRVRSAKLVFIGDGKMRPEVERLADELSLRQDIILTGVQSDVRPFLAAADVSVVSGGGETLSLAALESMAMGIPVVIADVGGASEIVNGENGRLFELGDIERLAQVLADVAKPGVAETMGQAARRTVEENFDARTMIQNYAGTFSRLVAERVS